MSLALWFPGACFSRLGLDDFKQKSRSPETSHTVKIMLDTRHGVIIFPGTHLTHARTEAGNGKDDDVSDLLDLLHAGEVPPGHIPLAGPHVKVVLIVEIGKHTIRPEGRTGKLDDAIASALERASLLPPQRFFGDGGDDVDQDGMSGLGLDGPLAELDPARVPFRPIRPIWIGLDADHEPIARAGNGVGHPFVRRFQDGGVDITIDAPAGQQDQIAEEVGLEDGKRKGVVGVQHRRDGGVEISHEVHGGIVGDDLVHEGRMLLGPAGLGRPEILGELARGRGDLPRLPDVGRKLGLDVVGELFFQPIPQRPSSGAGQGLLSRRLRVPAGHPRLPGRGRVAVRSTGALFSWGRVWLGGRV